jgi:hydroxypyruvate isomerase
MDRRDFGKTLAAVVGSSLLPRSFAQAEKDKTGDTPFKLSVMLWTVFKELGFEQRLEKVSEAGYHAIELVDEYDNWSSDDFRRFNAKRNSLHMTFDAIALVKKGIADPRERDAFLVELNHLLRIAEQLECQAIIVLSGNKVPGLSRKQHHQSCLECLNRSAEIASRRNVTLLLENIDPEENPRYYLTSVAEAFQIVRQVDHPHVKVLYDFYHEQIAEGNLIEKLHNNIKQVGLVHIADVPGRHAPGTGEINYSNIFRKLTELKYDGYAAMEFLPVGNAVDELRSAREMVLQSAAG